MPLLVSRSVEAGGCPGKLRQDLIVGIVGQRAANADRMFAGGIDVEIHFSHDRPVVAMAGRVEAEAAEVEPAVLAEGRIVARRIRIQYVEHLGIHALMCQIHLPDFRGRERLYGAIRHLETENALPHRVGRDGARHRHAAGIRALLIIEEVEHAVALQFASHRRAELVADQRLDRHARLIVEPRVGGRNGIAIVFVQRSVKLVRSALW